MSFLMLSAHTGQPSSTCASIAYHQTNFSGMMNIATRFSNLQNENLLNLPQAHKLWRSGNPFSRRNTMTGFSVSYLPFTTSFGVVECYYCTRGDTGGDRPLEIRVPKWIQAVSACQALYAGISTIMAILFKSASLSTCFLVPFPLDEENGTKRPGGAVSTSQISSLLKCWYILSSRIIKFSIQYASLGGWPLYLLSWRYDLTINCKSSNILRLQPHMDAWGQVLLEEEIYILYCTLYSV